MRCIVGQRGVSLKSKVQSCIQIYNAGQSAIEGMDPAADRIELAPSWPNMEALALDSPRHAQ